MRKTPTFITIFIVGISAVIGWADTKDEWQLKMKLKDGSTKTLMLEGVDSLVLGDTEKAEVKPGDVDENGEPLLMDVSYKPMMKWVWYYENEAGNATIPYVERTRTYSDSSVVVDLIVDYEWIHSLYGGMGHNTDKGGVSFDIVGPNKEPYIDNPYIDNRAVSDFTWNQDDEVQLHENTGGKINAMGERIIFWGDGEIRETDTELSFIITHSSGIDYLNGLYIDEYIQEPSPTLNSYFLSTAFDDNGYETYPLDCPIDLINAWYAGQWIYNYAWFINREDGISLQTPDICFRYTDKYLRMGGKIIDFLDFKPKVEKFGPYFEKSTCSRGDCYILRCGMKTELCGIQQNVFVTDTIYEIKYDKPVLRYLTPLESVDMNIAGGSSNDILKISSSGGYVGYCITSSLQPIVDLTGKGYSVEITDMGEDPTRTNRSLPFHKWNVRVNIEENTSDEDRDGILHLLDSDGESMQTITYKTLANGKSFDDE